MSTKPGQLHYATCPGRGFNDAATVLGTDYAGVLVRDGWAPYRCYDGLHQTCLNHLLQRCKQLREDHPDSLWAGEVQAVLRAGLDLRDRCNAGALSEHGMATARGRLTARLARLVDAPPPLDDAERFAAHLATEFPAVFLFLWDPSLDATNWRAEQAIRPAVVIRKVCGGNRTRHGADTQQVLASVVRTARQRNLDLPPLITAMLRAAEPVVPELLGLPPPPAWRAAGAERSARRTSWRSGSGRARLGPIRDGPAGAPRRGRAKARAARSRRCGTPSSGVYVSLWKNNHLERWSCTRCPSRARLRMTERRRDTSTDGGTSTRRVPWTRPRRLVGARPDPQGRRTRAISEPVA